MMFNFIVRYLGFLKHVPLVAWLADALMMIWCCFFNRSILNAIDRIEAEVSTWAGIELTVHKYGGVQFNYDAREVGHIHSNGVLDILFDRKTKADLLEAGRVTDHHIFRRSGWITFYIRSQNDAGTAIGLLALAYRRYFTAHIHAFAKGKPLNDHGQLISLHQLPPALAGGTK